MRRGADKRSAGWPPLGGTAPDVQPEPKVESRLPADENAASSGAGGPADRARRLAERVRAPAPAARGAPAGADRRRSKPRRRRASPRAAAP
ncbi:hypothetical protein AB1399_09000, partial [Hydrogenibacillus schlegelii]|uniref:hypothetical protein n=1 Tax=Hydrogenibacillus schlegelii TaxID=1484 RepID=UPI0034A01FC4